MSIPENCCIMILYPVDLLSKGFLHVRASTHYKSSEVHLYGYLSAVPWVGGGEPGAGGRSAGWLVVRLGSLGEVSVGTSFVFITF